MKITCPSCGAKYAIADDKVRGRRVKVRCKSCNEPIIVDGFSEAPPPVQHQEATHVANAGGGEIWSVNLTDTDQRSMTTNEIISMWNSGQMPADAFVWKEGMGDWLPVQSAPELAQYLNTSMQPVAAAPPVQPSNPFAFQSAPRAATPEPARVAGGRARGADLFGGFAQAGSEEEAVASAPAPGSTPYEEQKPTGARNENSVLFSLDALKVGGPVSAPGARAAVTDNRSKRSDDKADLDDIMNLGGGGGGGGLFGLAAANQALLNAPPPPPDPPKPKPVVYDPVPGSMAPAAYAPPQKNNKMLIAVGGGVAGLVIIGLVIALIAGRSDKTKDETGKADTAQKKDKKSETASGEKKSDDTSTEKKEGESATSPVGSTGEKKEVSEEDKKRFAEAMKKKEEEGKKEGDKPGDKPPDTTKKDEPSSGVSSFNKGAAIAALGAAAAQASGCKRAGGPTGSGKAVVTFAPSGKVTSANITGGDFPGTPVGSCVAGVFQRANVPAFSGDPVTVSKGFSINP